MNKREDETRVVGIGWYRAEQWSRLLEASVDRDDLESSHAEWEAGAKLRLAEFRATGVVVERFDVDVEDLVRWCDATGCALDGRARARYVAERLRARDSQRPSGPVD